MAPTIESRPRGPTTIATILLLASVAFACGAPPASAPPDAGPRRRAVVEWDPSRERAVNAPGGGYVVYYATSSGFDVRAARSVRVPYVDGPRAPTTIALPEDAPGTYYVRVAAFSALFGGQESEPSAEVEVEVTAP